MLEENQATATSWQERWPRTVTILREIPIVRSYFKQNSIYDAGKCIAGITGSISMMMYISNQTDPMPINTVKMATSMVVGGPIGKYIYMGVCNRGAMLYNYTTNINCKPCCRNNIENYDVETQPINAPSTSISNTL